MDWSRFPEQLPQPLEADLLSFAKQEMQQPLRSRSAALVRNFAQETFTKNETILPHARVFAQIMADTPLLYLNFEI